MVDIQLEVHDGIAVATLDRPARLNAFRSTTYEEMLGLAARLESERGWRALVITGAGRAFCAGQDLHDLPEAGLATSELERGIARLQDITRHLVASTKPTVAAINGPAVGFGLELTLGLDLRIAAESAYFLLPELAHGLFHTNGTYHYLTRLVGHGLAADMLLTGRRVGAADALTAGLVTRVVPPSELLPQAIAAARQLASIDPAAFSLTRRGLREASCGSVEDALQFEARACLTLLTQRSPR